MTLLDRLHGPEDVRAMTAEELEALAVEMRDFLVNTIAETGGHLSPNLGVVELSLALHRTFDSPRDAIVWDTGHQSYVHKLITGRAEGFASLRRRGGMSGYPSRAESAHDLVENSHASTSLSYAAGMAEARTRRGEPGHVVAVIGDGALTGGMAYEALNHIAHLQPKNLVIVINDNGRSYAPTIGGLASHLAYLRVSPRYERLKLEIAERLRDLPMVGDRAAVAAYRLKEGLKQLVTPATVFDSLGLKYTGPVDGHDIAALEAMLGAARELQAPVVVHVLTEKGHGYGPAVDDEIDKLHGVSAFDRATGRALRTELSYTDVFGQAMLSAATRHPGMVAMTAAMASPTGLLDFSREFPDRFFDVGICEQHAVTFAAGLALAGLHPVVAIYSTFLQRAYDQVIHDVAMHNLPVTLVLDRAGVTGPDGSSHHGAFDMAFLRAVPNLSVASPASASELCALLEAALDAPGPVAIRYPKAGVPAMPELPVTPLRIGEWEEVRAGTDIAVIAIGRMVGIALEAAERVAAEGIACGVINARWLKPIDPRLVSTWAPRYPVLMTAEDGVYGGLGAAVLEALVPAGMAGRVVEVACIPDGFLPHGSAGEILAEIRLDADGLTGRIRNAVRARGDAELTGLVQ